MTFVVHIAENIISIYIEIKHFEFNICIEQENIEKCNTFNVLKHPLILFYINVQNSVVEIFIDVYLQS